MANKETMIELVLVKGDGSKETKSMSVEHAENLLRLSKKRGWGWAIPEDSQYAYDEKTDTIYRKKSLRKSVKKRTNANIKYRNYGKATTESVKAC